MSNRSDLSRGIVIRKAAGFSLFELVVFIISVAIIYAYAANRFSDFPGQAERANFMAVSTQLQSAINLEMMVAIGTGRLMPSDGIEGINPMEMLLEPPSNYMGAFDFVDVSRLPRRTWYFDQSRGELVYLVNDPTGVAFLLNGQEIPTDEIRFKIMADFGEVETRTGLPIDIAEASGRLVPQEQRSTRFNGVLMRPTIPYRWGEVDADLLITESDVDFSG